MDPIKILQKYYDKDSAEYQIVLEHSRAVTKKALEIAKHVPELKPDLQFIKEAAMLHDIGFIKTRWGLGKEDYILHGILGKEILDKEGLPKHALVSERHIGVGISKEDIKKQRLTLPKKDMIPQTVEEEIIALADGFFTKSKKNQLSKERTLEDVRKNLAQFGAEKVQKFDSWLKKFNYPLTKN